MTGQKETECKKTGGKVMGAKETGGRETGGKPMGRKVTEVREMGGEMDNMLPSDTTAGQNVTQGIRHKSYTEVVIEGVKRRARVFVGYSIVRKTDRALNKGDYMVDCFPGTKIEATIERVEKIMGIWEDIF